MVVVDFTASLVSVDIIIFLDSKRVFFVGKRDTHLGS
jgi:hypothetical protein